VPEKQGFRPIRYFLRMERSSAEPLVPPQLPVGFALRPVAGDHKAEAWAELFNQSFVDHWEHHPLSAEGLRRVWQQPLYARELDLVVVAPDGVLAAFWVCEVNPDGPDQAGWAEVSGTRRGYRGRGFGRALLQAGLARLQQIGVKTARLIVDAENPTGATRLYEAADFRETRREARSPGRPIER
jgi:ribosomal protein S18 acetylase RimI-like enzyme